MTAVEWLLEAVAGDPHGYAQVTRDLAASGGPRSRRAQAAILAAAWHLFREQGYEGFTMEDLAERAGVSRPSLYSYFHSKRAIFLALAIAVNCRYQDAIGGFTTIGKCPTSWRQLEPWVSDYLSFLEETHWVTLMWDQVVSADDRLRAEGVRQQSAAWTTFGSHMATLRGTSAHDPLADGMITLAMLERVWFYWSLAAAPFSRGQLVAELTSVLQAMIRRP